VSFQLLRNSTRASALFSITKYNLCIPHPHEAALAVERVDPSKFWDYSLALFEQQTGYFDSSTATETQLNMYRYLATLAEETIFIKAEDILEHLNLMPVEISSSEGHNIGNAVLYPEHL